jgi:hypothetical protein
MPRGDLVDFNARFTCPQGVVETVRIRRIVLAEDNHRKTHLSIVRNVMENIDRHKVLRLPSFGVVPLLVRHSVSSSAVVPQL